MDSFIMDWQKYGCSAGVKWRKLLTSGSEPHENINLDFLEKTQDFNIFTRYFSPLKKKSNRKEANKEE